MKDISLKKLYYSISEASKITDLEQYILRYWETEFEQLRPSKNRAGNRIYTNKDIQLIFRIKKLLREEKYTIDSAKKILEALSTEPLINFIEVEENKKIFIPHTPIITVTNNVIKRMIEDFYINPEKLKNIDRRKFEEMVAELFTGFGYNVELTKQTRDGGKDIIAIKKCDVNLKYLIECKRPDPGNPVSISPVRELYAVKTSERATKGILATTSFFTKDALSFFNMHKWELEPKDYNGIMAWIADYLK